VARLTGRYNIRNRLAEDTLYDMFELYYEVRTIFGNLRWNRGACYSAPEAAKNDFRKMVGIIKNKTIVAGDIFDEPRSL
jgi:hypothetical protein